MAPQKITQWKSGQNGLDKLYMEEADIPTPGEDEVLVEIHSVSLNYRDTEGMLEPRAPAKIGSDSAQYAWVYTTTTSKLSSLPP